MKRFLVAVFAVAAIAGALANPLPGPGWWPPGVSATSSPGNYTPANLGQLKNMATLAKAHLDATLVGGAGFYVEQMVAGFGPDNGVAYTQAEKDENYRPVNLGQLKAVALPFYERLKAAGYDVKGSLSARLNATPPTAWPFDVPWNPSTARSVNYSPANIGQLKFVFSFDLTDFDTDHDGLGDAWETAQFGNLTRDGSGDFDNDGVVDLSEFLYGGNPKLADGDYDGRSDAEEMMEGTNPADAADVSSVKLGYFAMSDSALLTEDGKAPKTSVSNTLVTGRKGSGLSKPGSGSKLIYQHTETDASANINLQKGSVRLWIKPNWTSGAGPGSLARLIECGEYSGSANIGWWCIYVSSDGTSLRLASQDGLGHTRESLICNISWYSGLWYQVVVTYDGTGSALYVNGAHVEPTPPANGLGIAYLPPQTQRDRGISIGADLSGNQGIKATIDEVETFNYRLSADQIAADYSAEYALGIDANGNGLPDAWDTANFSGITGKTGAQDDYDGDGLTNYQEWQRGTNPKDTDTDYDGRSDAMEVADGTNPTSDASAKQVRLASWGFGAETLASDAGRAPLSKSDPSNTLWTTAGFGGRGLNMTGSSGGPYAVYRDVEPGGMPNINFKRGTVRFWIKPNWTSSTPSVAGGPGVWGRIVEAGTWTPDSSIGNWVLHLDPTGNNLVFSGEDDQGHPNGGYYSPINWTAGQWYQVALVYNPTGFQVWVNGALAGSGPSVTVMPPPAIRALGLRFGTNAANNERANATIDEIETFNYELPGTKITADYTKRNTLGVDSDNDGLSDAWEILKFGNLNQTATGDPDTDGWTNLDEWRRNTNPNNPDRTKGPYSEKPEAVGANDGPTGGMDVTWAPTSGGEVTIQNSTDGVNFVTVGFANGSTGTFTDPDSDPNAPAIYRVGSPGSWSALAASDPSGDFDGDGLSNQEETANGTDPGSTDSDKDGVLDGVDGWAHASKLSPPRLGATSYAVIEIWDKPADWGWINNKGQAAAMKWRDTPPVSAKTKASYWANGESTPLPDGFTPIGISDEGEIGGNTEASHGRDLSEGGGDFFVHDNSANIAGLWTKASRLRQAEKYWNEVVTAEVPPVPGGDKLMNRSITLRSDRWLSHITTNGDLYGTISLGNGGGWASINWTVPGSFQLYEKTFYGVYKFTESLEPGNVIFYTLFELRDRGSRDGGPEWNTYSSSENVTAFSPDFINDSSIFAGTWSIERQTGGFVVLPRKCIREGTVYTYLSEIGGSDNSIVYALSDGKKPWLIGHAGDTGDTLDIWTKNSKWELATPESHGFTGTASAVNKRGEIVGSFTDSNGKTGQLIRDQQVIDLNESNPDWHIERITDINESGIMVGSAKKVRDEEGEAISVAEQEEKAIMLLPIEVSISPEDPYAGADETSSNGEADLTQQVSADQPETYVQLSVFVLGKDEDGNPAMVPAEDGTVVKWELMEGSDEGSLSESETTTEDGFAAVKLSTSTHPGDLYKVKAKVTKLGWQNNVLENSGEAPLCVVESGVIEVVPGKASTITVAVSGDGSGNTMPADGKSKKVLTATINDKNGNAVAGGTEVYWHLKGQGRFEDAGTTADVDGKVTASVDAGTIPGVQQVEIEADGVTHVETLQNSAISVGLTSSLGSLDMATGQSCTLTATFPNAASGAEVRWYTTKGRIINAATSVSGGQAQATLQAHEMATTGDALVFVSIGGNVKMLAVPFTSSGPIKVSVTRPVIAGDATIDGVVGVPSLDGSTEQVPYHVSTNVVISAPSYAGYEATVALGTTLPNWTFTFGLNSATGGNSLDGNGLYSIALNTASLNTTIKHAGAASLEFNGVSAASLASNSAFQSQTKWSVTAWIRPGVLGGTLLSKSGEYSLSLNSSGKPVFSIVTSTGSYSVTAPVPVSINQWTKVAASIGGDGKINVSVGSQTNQAVYSGTLQTGSSAVQIGTGYTGHIDDIVFSQGTTFGTPMSAPWTVSGLDAAGKVTLNGTGQATITMTGSGTMNNPAMPHGESVSVRVSINPTETVESAVQVVPKAEYTLISAMTGSLKVSSGSQAAALTDAQRGEIMAKQISQVIASGQRAAGVVPLSASTIEDNAEKGFRAAIWMEETTDAAGKVSHIMKSAIEGVPSGVADQMNNQLAELMNQAAARGDDSSFASYVQENAGPLLEALYNQSQNEEDQFNKMVGAFDGEQTWIDGVRVTHAYGDKLIEDIGQIAEEEDLPPTFTQRVLSGLGNYLFSSPLAKWKNTAFNGAEDWMRKHLAESVADGTMEPQAAAAVGYFWGLAKTINDTSTSVVDQAANIKMLGELMSTMVRATSGDQAAQQSLLDMLPVYGTYRSFEDANTSWEAQNYFDSGIQMYQGTLGAVGDVALVGGVATKSIRLLSKLNKHLEPLRKWTSPIKRPANMLIDRFAMDFAKKMLERRGYRDIISLTNNSNHGIDYLARKTLANGQEVLVHIEVKGHWLSGDPKLRLSQRERVEFVRSRLQTIVNNSNGRWSPNKIDPKIVARAQEALDEIRDGQKIIHGMVIDVDYALSWFPGPKGEVFTWPRNGGNPFHPLGGQ
jgi:hypothetical protein